MNTGSDAPGQTDARELVTRRVIDAARELVFRAFPRPEHFAQWCGPNGFRNTVHEFAFRVGGRWRVTMRGPDGTEHENEYVFLEIEMPKGIVISHPDPAHSLQLPVVLNEEAERTRLTWRMRFDSAEHCQQVKPFVTGAKEQNLSRFEGELARMD